MKQYREFIIRTDPFNPDLISGFLWELNISGINEEEDLLKIFADDNSGVTEGDIKNLLQKLIDNRMISSFKIEAETHEYKNWNEEWEKGLNVIGISDRIVIKPSFKEYENKPDEIVITIDPKMSFGTGEHQTTKLVIQLMEKYINEGIRVLDVGTGTGILSIAAVKLGVKSALAIDNDEWCLENIEDNIKLNNADDKIEIRICTIQQIEVEKYDLVLANIQKNVLLDIAGEIIERLNDRGILILSGLLIEDEKDIAKKYNRLNLLERKTMGEWLALVFQKL